MSASHAVPLDQAAAEEIGSLLALIESIDAELLRGGLVNKKGDPRALVDLRIRASGRLERWLREFGATPASRVDWVGKLTSADDLVQTLRRELAASPLEQESGGDRYHADNDTADNDRCDDYDQHDGDDHDGDHDGDDHDGDDDDGDDDGGGDYDGGRDGD